MSTPNSPAVTWDGLALNTGDQDSGLFSIIEMVAGWIDSPPFDGHDAVRAVADGSAWGPKTLLARTVTLNGAAVAGPRLQLAALRDQIAMRASNRQPAPLTITDASGDGRALTSSVRAGADALALTWLSPNAYRWQAVLTAADPLLYEDNWQQATLVAAAPGVTGRVYKRSYHWQYGSPLTPNVAELLNAGNAAAPVWVLYQGDLVYPELSDTDGNQITLGTLAPGEQITLETDTLAAWAPGGASRSSYVLPGSVPMLVPPQSTARWSLYAQGSGQVTLAWRSAWT